MAYYTYQNHQEYYSELDYDSPVYYTNFNSSTYEEQNVGHPDQGTYEDNYNPYAKAFMPSKDMMAPGFGPEVGQEEGESRYQEEVWEEEEMGKEFDPREEFDQEYGQVEDFREYSPTQDWEEGEGTWDWERNAAELGYEEEGLYDDIADGPPLGDHTLQFYTHPDPTETIPYHFDSSYLLPYQEDHLDLPALLRHPPEPVLDWPQAGHEDIGSTREQVGVQPLYPTCRNPLRRQTFAHRKLTGACSHLESANSLRQQ